MLNDLSPLNHTLWFGVIEDRLDPLELGRYRVRVLGVHPEKREDFPTEKLPWAQVLMPPTTASMNGKGDSPIGLVDGAWVIGTFLDGHLSQLPLIIGSIYGMNEKLRDGENFGDGFRDVREDLSIYPTDKFKKKEYPDGRTNDGDEHGAQLENDKSRKYPRAEYSPESSGRERGTPDLNILTINDKKRLDKTIVPRKRQNFPGGLRDSFVDVADNYHPDFVCGVTGESGAALGTLKMAGLFGGAANAQASTCVPSRKFKSKQFVDKPTNNNNFKIDSEEQLKTN